MVYFRMGDNRLHEGFARPIPGEKRPAAIVHANVSSRKQGPKMKRGQEGPVR
jgi:hypothetical protein